MEFSEKLTVLKARIKDNLLPLINNDYVLWDCPYYSNIGDTLIWEGERTFLKELPYKCVGYASYITCTFPRLASNVIILLRGGGNFGDLWRVLQDFRLKVIRHYPNNRIIILPQSVCYQETQLMEEDARIMAGHPLLTLCARDKISYDIFKRNFQNPVLLVPDMAFYISDKILEEYRKTEQNKILFLKRTDKELVQNSYHIDGKGLPIDVRDWPTMEKEPLYLWLLRKSSGLCRRLKDWQVLQRIVAWFVNDYALNICRYLLLKQGIGFVSSYKYIYTTRLHVMILSVLLHKRCYFFDNSYGKNKNLYDTWLIDLDECCEVNN